MQQEQRSGHAIGVRGASGPTGTSTACPASTGHTLTVHGIGAEGKIGDTVTVTVTATRNSSRGAIASAASAAPNAMGFLALSLSLHLHLHLGLAPALAPGPGCSARTEGHLPSPPVLREQLRGAPALTDPDARRELEAHLHSHLHGSEEVRNEGHRHRHRHSIIVRCSRSPLELKRCWKGWRAAAADNLQVTVEVAVRVARSRRTGGMSAGASGGSGRAGREECGWRLGAGWRQSQCARLLPPLEPLEREGGWKGSAGGKAVQVQGPPCRCR
jgi:hypothetical protein